MASYKKDLEEAVTEAKTAVSEAGLSAEKQKVSASYSYNLSTAEGSVAQETYKAAIKQLQDPMYQSLYQAFLQTQEQYTFYTAPQYDDYLELETRFEEQIRQKLQIARRSYLELPEQSTVELVRATLESFMRDYQP